MRIESKIGKYLKEDLSEKDFSDISKRTLKAFGYKEASAEICALCRYYSDYGCDNPKNLKAFEKLAGDDVIDEISKDYVPVPANGSCKNFRKL